MFLKNGDVTSVLYDKFHPLMQTFYPKVTHLIEIISNNDMYCIWEKTNDLKL